MKTATASKNSATAISKNYVRPTRRVLRIVRANGRTSRAALTKATGLDKAGLEDALKRLVKRERLAIVGTRISLAA